MMSQTYPSTGFHCNRQIVVRDRSDPSKVVHTFAVGRHTRISFKPIDWRGKIAHSLKRLNRYRMRPSEINQAWRLVAQALASGAVSVICDMLKTIESLVSRVALDEWRTSFLKIRLPAACGTRPYFPAAP